MKNWLNFRKLIFLFLVVSGTALLHSCVVYRPYSFTPLTVDDIVKMSKDKVTAKYIIDEIRKSHTAYTLQASEYAKLQQDGVADSVVNYMEKTHLDLVRNSQQTQDSYYVGPGYGGYWYGGLGYGWPYGYGSWNMAPTIVFRGGGSNYRGGGFRGGGHGRR